MSEKSDDADGMEEIDETLENEDSHSHYHNHKWSYEGTQNWAWGASLILVGILFLLDNFGIASIRTYNWWAIFILAPGMSMLSKAFQLLKEKGRFTRGSQRNGIFGLVLVLVAISFLFGIGFNLIWPVFLISGGFYLLFSKK